MGVKEFQYLPDKWDWDTVLGNRRRIKNCLRINLTSPFDICRLERKSWRFLMICRL